MAFDGALHKKFLVQNPPFSKIMQHFGTFGKVNFYYNKKYLLIHTVVWFSFIKAFAHFTTVKYGTLKFKQAYSNCFLDGDKKLKFSPVIILLQDL